MNKVPANVVTFLDRSAECYGKIRQNYFADSIYGECLRLNSPIEQLFLIAFALVCAENLKRCLLRDSFSKDERDGDIVIVPQLKVDRYKIDFAIAVAGSDSIVCVELDGHAFHDRDERQRRYEKTRDRALTAKGYKVFHFTGSEVNANPLTAAAEVFKVVSGISGNVSIPAIED